MDRAARKIIVENGGKHPASLTSLLYLPREKGGRGLQSVEQFALQFPGYKIKQRNIIIDVLGGYSRDVDGTMIKLFGERENVVLSRMQKPLSLGH